MAEEPQGNVEITVIDRRGEAREQESEPPPPQPTPPPQAQPGQQAMAEAQCGRCKTQIFLRFPIVRVINAPEFSMMVLSHEKPQVCHKCGQAYVPTLRGIEGVEKNIQWSPINIQQQPIVAPANAAQVAAVEQTRNKARGLVMP